MVSRKPRSANMVAILALMPRLSKASAAERRPSVVRLGLSEKWSTTEVVPDLSISRASTMVLT